MNSAHGQNVINDYGWWVYANSLFSSSRATQKSEKARKGKKVKPFHWA
jgi:hypothetical protein